MADQEVQRSKRSSSNTAETEKTATKRGAKQTPTRKNNDDTSKSQMQVTADVHTAPPDVSKQMFEMLKSIQENQNKQDKKIADMMQRMDDYENYDFENDYHEYDETHYEANDNVIVDDNNNEPPAKRQKVDQKLEKDSRFSSMSKRFKIKEICSGDIDEVLAKNITDLFRNGMDDDQYSQLVKDDANSRPANCDGLMLVKTNQLVWDIITPEARTVDKKMQNIEQSVLKAATILTKVVDKMATVENDMEKRKTNETDTSISTEKENGSLGDFIDKCNDVLALLGHTNRQINLARRDFIRPELRHEYLHLCAQSVPYTDKLFGDDVSKTAKEIEDCSKMGHKIQYDTYRGASFRGRSRGFRGRSRGRGRSMRGSYRYPQSSAYTARPVSTASKNPQKPQRGRTY